MEGAPGQGVSGPSAGIAMVASLLSELSGLLISPSVVSTGTIGVKFDVGPVGGLGGYGTQTGKIIGILKSRRVKISDLILPTANYNVAKDEMHILTEAGVRVHPINTFTDCIQTLFGVTEKQLAQKIRKRFDRFVST